VNRRLSAAFCQSSIEGVPGARSFMRLAFPDGRPVAWPGRAVPHKMSILRRARRAGGIGRPAGPAPRGSDGSAGAGRKPWQPNSHRLDAVPARWRRMNATSTRSSPRTSPTPRRPASWCRAGRPFRTRTSTRHPGATRTRWSRRLPARGPRRRAGRQALAGAAALLACLRARLVYLPLNTGYQKGELAYFFAMRRRA